MTIEGDSVASVPSLGCVAARPAWPLITVAAEFVPVTVLGSPVVPCEYASSAVLPVIVLETVPPELVPKGVGRCTVAPGELVASVADRRTLPAVPAVIGKCVPPVPVLTVDPPSSAVLLVDTCPEGASKAVLPGGPTTPRVILAVTGSLSPPPVFRVMLGLNKGFVRAYHAHFASRMHDFWPPRSNSTYPFLQMQAPLSH